MADAIEQDAKFFDYLVELIPARFYHGDGDDRVNLRMMNKSARAAAKQEFKAKAHENKRKKLNPDAPATALEIQQGASAAGASNGSTAPAPMHLGGASLSREELKAKLQRKIESIHQQRSPQDKQELAAQAKAWRQKTLENSAKTNQQQHKAQQQQKRKPESQPDGVPQGASKQQQQRGQGQPHTGRSGPGEKGDKGAAEGKAAPGDGDDLNFARIDFEETKPRGPWHKKPTKEQLLAAAEAKQADKAAAVTTKQGQVKVVNEAWRTALARASGEKVLDDPKLLRRSIKKEVKRKEKSSKQWQERKAAQQGVQDRKQQKRNDNLKARVDTKMTNKKNAREKKLLRAGFEGRKEGFIGASKKPAAA